MALTPLFTVSQTTGSPDKITFTDISTGSDANVVERHIYLEKFDGTFLVPDGTTTDYIIWPLVDNPFTISVLKKDMALSTSVQWVDGNFFLLSNDTDFILINSTDKIIL